MQEVLKHKMNQMKLFGMQRAYQALLETGQQQALTNDEVISLLIQSEWEQRQTSKVNRYLHNARFRYQASLEELDFDSNRNLDKTLIMRLAECSFIKRKEDVLITGPTGVGKSYLASVFGHQACGNGYKVVYFNTQKLFARLKMSKGDGSYIKEIARIEKHDVLILDDFGLAPLDNPQRDALMEIIEDRHGRKSTIISSQLPVSSWYEIIGESTIADAILDRLVHKSHRLELKGTSMRKRQQKEELL